MSVLLNLLVLQGVLLPLVVSQDGPVVSTKYGQVEGMSLETGDGDAYDEFRGIPFGTAPEGMLRWEKPVEPAPWDGVLPAKEFGRVCPQLVLPWAREDCLYINVYVPDSVEEHVDDPLPVMVWVYGGAFLLGSGSFYNGKLVATRGRVVIVTFNYRVGTGGFLSTQSNTAPGNYGLWDQVAALKWVQENIAAFGGDSNRVTIIGQSAGGASVSHLSLSPEARGLFHRVIALSGNALSPFALATRQAVTTRNLARHYDCPDDNDAAMVECLREESAFTLTLDGLIVPLEYGYPPNFVPVVDGELVAIDPLEAMKLGLNADFDLLAGRGRDDASMFSLPVSDSPESFRSYLLLRFSEWANREELADMVFAQYPDLSGDDALLRDQAASQSMTDMKYGCGLYREVGYHSQNAASTGKSTYFYEFDYSYLTKDSWVSGMHTEDVIMFFGDAGIIFTFDDEDKIVSRNIQSYYCNFAYTGNPNEGPHEVPTEWPQYDVTNKMQMRQSLNMTTETLSEDVIARYNWWNEVFYPAAIPVDSSSSPQMDPAETSKKFAKTAEKFAPLNPDDPYILQALARAIKETTEKSLHVQ